ncbi:unnamed protein product, partial [Owenia fusiformis]
KTRGFPRTDNDSLFNNKSSVADTGFTHIPGINGSWTRSQGNVAIKSVIRQTPNYLAMNPYAQYKDLDDNDNVFPDMEKPPDPVYQELPAYINGRDKMTTAQLEPPRQRTPHDLD